MKRFFSLAAVVLLIGCTTTPKEPLKTYAILVSSEKEAPDFQIAAKYFTGSELFGKEGIAGFNIGFKNSGTRIARVLWEESSINYNGNSYPVFIDGQKYSESSRPMPPMIVPAGGLTSKSVFSADQPHYVSGQYGGWQMRPIHAESVQIILCVESEAGKNYFTISAQ